jgi:outer membrane protein OmpA-like peptidoglycan-associated protein
MPEDSIFNNKFSEAPKSIEMNQQTVQINKVDQNYKHIDGEQFLSFTEQKFLVHFKPNSANLDSSAFEILNKVVEIIHKVPNSEIIIEGYADSYGGNVFNKRLSEFRANIIKSYLIGRGVDSLRITAIGFGSDMPIADNLTSEGRQKNRRVEIKIKTKSDGA